MRGTKKLAKYFLTLSCFLILGLFSFAVIVQAASDNIHRIDITVQLMDDGSAQITQVWNTSRDSGTEGYIPQTNLGDIEIINFGVSDETGTIYQNIGSWNVKASLEDKANKCGINTTSDGLELCWGIGSYGEHTYTLTYTMTNFIKHYADDTYGFYSRFVNSKLSNPPEEIQVTIQRQDVILSSENAGIWGFGYSGDIEFIDGSVIARNTKALTKSNHVTVLMRLNSDIVSGSASSDLTFREVEAVAKKGSDYDDELAKALNKGRFFVWVYMFRSLPILYQLGILAFILYFVHSITTSFTKKGPKRIKSKEIVYYRDIPMNGELPACYYALDYYHHKVKKSNLISAYLLKWIKQGYITVDIRESKNTLGSGKRMETSLILNKLSITAERIEERLFQIMFLASGKDHILQEKELKQWISRNYYELSYWFDGVERAGQKQLIDCGWAMPRGATTSSYDFAMNAEGRRQSLNLFGFKKYLKDFTLVNEREAKEVHLWDDYLVFATLFNCADEVAKQFKELNPQYIQSSAYSQNSADFFTTKDFVDDISKSSYRAMRSAESKAKSSSSGRSSGGGGSSSSGGGDTGYSGGGSGGGFR